MRKILASALFGFLVCVACISGNAFAANVYVLPANPDPLLADNIALTNALVSRGHSVTIGPAYYNYNGASLAAYNAVVLLPNSYWSSVMPNSGQEALRDYVTGGGGLVTGEWTMWMYHPTLDQALPVTCNSTYNYATSTTYSRPTDRPLDAVMDYLVPSSFTVHLHSYGGTQSLLYVKTGAEPFYKTTYGSDPDAVGLAGWDYGDGRSASFSTLISATELSNENYAQLFSNSVYWVAGESTLVPLPGAIFLLGSGLFGFAAVRWRSKA